MAALRAALRSGGRGQSESDQVYKRAFETQDWKLVESVNALGDAFFDEFLREDVLNNFDQNIHSMRLCSPDVLLERIVAQEFKLQPAYVSQCLDLIERTSRADYNTSGQKWSRAVKKKEMLLPDMKYLILGGFDSTMNSKTRALQIYGFVSFMITYEDGHEVIYIYEIHFLPSQQGRGYGGHMMDVVEAIGREVGVGKAMLTVFKSNERAVNWYYKREYVVDEYSPEPRRFRDGTVKEPSYLILSKNLKNTRVWGDVKMALEAQLEIRLLRLEPRTSRIISPWQRKVAFMRKASAVSSVLAA